MTNYNVIKNIFMLSHKLMLKIVPKEQLKFFLAIINTNEYLYHKAVAALLRSHLHC